MNGPAGPAGRARRHRHLRGPQHRPGRPRAGRVLRAADPASLPLAADGTVDEDKLPEGAFVGEIEAFPAGQSCTGTFELPAGSTALFCDLLETEADGSKENHYANGMRTRFEARG